MVQPYVNKAVLTFETHEKISEKICRCETGAPVFRIETTTDLDEGTMRRSRASFLSCLDDLNVFKNEMNVNFRSFSGVSKKS